MWELAPFQLVAEGKTMQQTILYEDTAEPGRFKQSTF